MRVSTKPEDEPQSRANCHQAPHGRALRSQGLTSSDGGATLRAMTVRAVFIFDRDDWCSVFASPEEAAANLEINDVESHEYAGFTDDGRVVTPIVEQEDVRVVVTDRRDVDGLQLRLQGCRRHHGFESAIDDPVGIANEILRADWKARWPKRPRWLARRLHGPGPRTI
jgi:hypothetical protein